MLALASDPHDPDRRLLAYIKGNLTKARGVLAYRLNDAGALLWESGTVTGTDVEALFRPASPADREERTTAEQVISDLLDGESWPLDAKRAIEAGQAYGIAERTLQAAARRLGIRVRREGFGAAGKWLWQRPEPIDAYPPQNPDVALWRL